MDLIINFTPTGNVPTKEMTPHVPISVDEIVEDVRRAVEIGITMVHLHARDAANGKPTYKAEVFGQIIAGVRSFSKDLVICVSLSGRNFKEFEQRAERLFLGGDLKPDMGSLSLSSLNFSREASVNAPEMVQKLASEMKSRGILPELEAFDLGMVNYAKFLEKKGLLEPPHYVNLFFGNVATAQADLLHVGTMLRDLPANLIWSLAGIGITQLMINTVAIASGGGIRVGLEDNIWFDEERTKLASNLDFIKRIHRIAETHGRKVMKPAELRKLLNLQPGHGSYGRIYGPSLKTDHVDRSKKYPIEVSNVSS